MCLPFLLGCFGCGPKLIWCAPFASEKPPIVQDGLVYVQAIRAGHPGSVEQVFALNALTGEERWASADTVEELYSISGGYVFCRNTAGHLVQLNAQTGEKIFESEANNPQILKWTTQGDHIFIVNDSMEVVAVNNRVSKVLWRMKLPFSFKEQTDLQLAGNNIIVSANFRDQSNFLGMIWCLNLETGKEIWHFEPPAPHEFAPLSVFVHAPYVLATNTSPLGLRTYVLDINTGKERYPPLSFFDVYGCYGHTAYTSDGTYDLQTGQKTGDYTNWISGCVFYNNIGWKRQLSSVNTIRAFTLRDSFDGDFIGKRNWLDTPPNSAMEGFDVSTGKSVFKTKTCTFTRFSTPVIHEGILYHTSIAVMKEGKSGVWAYRLSKGK